MTCPDCEYNKARAANWRSEAYRLGGHDYIPKLWVGLTLKDMPDDKFGRPEWLEGVRWAEAKLRERNT